VWCSNEITINMGRKFRGRAGYPSNTKSPGLRPTSVPSTILIHPAVWPKKHGPKIWGLRPLLGGGAGSPSNTKSPGPRPSSIPSDILIHAAIWPQRIWAENWGAVSLWRRGARSPSETMWQGRGLPTCKVSSWSVKPFGHNTPTLQTGQTDRQTDRRTGQTTDR